MKPLVWAEKALLYLRSFSCLVIAHDHHLLPSSEEMLTSHPPEQHSPCGQGTACAPPE